MSENYSGPTSVVVEQTVLSVEVLNENNVVEVVSEGIQGPPFEFVGGTTGQAWTALEGGNYGWSDVHPHDTVVIPFVNEDLLESNYSERFGCRVYVLGSSNVDGHIINVTADGVAEDFVCVGMVKINSDNEWDLNSRRMLFKSEQTANYVAFNDSLNSWVYGELGDHSTGHRSQSGEIVLNSNGTLPASFGSIVIDVNSGSIHSRYFSECDAMVEYLTDLGVVRISFSGFPQTGFIVL